MKRGFIITGWRGPLSAKQAAMIEDCIRSRIDMAEELGDRARIYVGCAKGVDALVRNLLPEAVIFKADWAEYSKAAGPMRNRAMIDFAVSDRDMVTMLAFPHALKGSGTWDCIRRASRSGVTTISIYPLV